MDGRKGNDFNVEHPILISRTARGKKKFDFLKLFAIFIVDWFVLQTDMTNR